MYVATRRRGLGDGQAAITGVNIGTSLGTPLLTGALAANAASTAAATGSAATILGMAPSLAVPVIGAALVGVSILVTALIRNSGCGITCVETSQWANQAEPLLKQNLAAYLALPTPRTQSQQNTALSNFEVVWEQLQKLCGQPGTGNAGVRCITDRQAGACKWKDANGNCFNWFSGYRDPIANDPNVVPDEQAALSSASSLLDGPGMGTLLLAGALIAVGAFAL
jgi:hypothetical protein